MVKAEIFNVMSRCAVAMAIPFLGMVSSVYYQEGSSDHVIYVPSHSGMFMNGPWRRVAYSRSLHIRLVFISYRTDIAVVNMSH